MQLISILTLGAIISSALPGFAADAPASDPVIFQEMINCKLASKAQEVPTSLAVFINDPEFRGQSKGILMMKMKNVHVPTAAMSMAVGIDVSANGDIIEGTAGKDWKISFNLKELNEYMFNRGPAFQATLKLSTADSLKYACSTTNRR